MEYRKIGQTDITVSALGCGCWDAAGVGYGDDMTAAVHRALDLGITCFDTAPVYNKGDSERLLGKALGPRRKDVVVVTKCGMGYENRPPKGRDSRRESILASVEESLRNLQTDYVDVLMPHWPDTNTPFEETMDTLDSLVRQGKVRAVGVSNFTLDQVKECQATRRVDVGQYVYNILDRRMEQEYFPYFQQQGIGVMVWGPLGSGILGGTYTADTEFGDRDWRGRGIREFDLGVYAGLPRSAGIVDDLKPIAASRGKTMAQFALRWVLSNPTVSVALVGTLNVQELEENLGVMDWTLSGEDMREIDEVLAKHGVDTRPDIALEP